MQAGEYLPMQTISHRVWLAESLGVIALFGLACARPESGAKSGGLPDLVLTNVTVIDGLGGAPRAGQTIEIRDGIITAVRATTPADHATLEVAGSFVTPGLIDSHMHFNPLDPGVVRSALDSLLRLGVTTVREMACCAPDYAKLLAESDTAPLPRIYASAFWAGPAFMRDDPRIREFPGVGRVPWALSVTDSTDLALALRGAKEGGATAIKIYSDLAPALVRRIATSAHGAGLRVWSHTTVFPTRPSEVVAADIDVVSHAALLVWEGAGKLPSHYDNPHPFNPFGPPAPYSSVSPRDPRVIQVLEAIRRRGIILDPTVVAMRTGVGDVAAHWAIEATRAAHEMGIPLTVGTDGISFFDEIETLVDSVGLTRLEALTSATSVGAAAIGVGAELGTVEAGKAADLVVYPSDPSADIRRLRKPSQVIRSGRVVRPSR